MQTDKQIYQILASSPDAFRLLTGGITLSGAYRCRSVAIKALERRLDALFEPISGEGPLYVVEFQAQLDPVIYHRIITEVALCGLDSPQREVIGILIFTHHAIDPAPRLWQQVAERCEVLHVVYLEDILKEGFAHNPEDPILNTFLPWWLEDVEQLAQHAPVAYQVITNAPIEAGIRERLQEVFISWMLERFKHKRYEEVLAMLNILTPLEETVAYKQLFGMGWEKGVVVGEARGRIEGKVEGRREEAQRFLQRLLVRRFGPLSEAQEAQLAAASLEQLEGWSDQILDAESLEELLGKG